MLFIKLLITFNVNYCMFKINCIYLPQIVVAESVGEYITTFKCR
jgi:hypothetical protein